MKNPPSERSRWFSEEIEPHDSSLRAYLHSRFPSLTDVDDIMQDSYIKVLQAAKRRPLFRAKAYLFATVRNAALGLLRRPRIFSEKPVTDIAALSVSEEGVDVAERVSTNQEIAILLDAIDALPLRCREIFILRKLQGVPQKEIAARLGISEQTVQVQIARGAKKCARFLRIRGVTGRFP
ncbi:MAG: sigma-70 family RNA polymerase sigma factor [Opitutaceae bacterium]|jgi:RNA polymerase sigma-70 factor (ECF subfamily)